MGGTGANTAAEARDALGVLANTGGTITGNLNVANTLFVSGNVAFGTNTPYTASGHTYLTIDNAINGGGLVLQRNSSPAFLATVDATSVYLDSPTSLPIRFFIGVTEAARIESNGNVGIGVTSPETKLDINGVVRFRNGTLTGSGFVEMASVSGVGLTMQSFSYVFKNSTNTTEFLKITSAGNVGIGTENPTQKLHVYSSGGGLELNTGANTTLEFIDRANTSATVNTSIYTRNGFFAFYTGGYTERLRITNDGNIGIGTTSPGTSLHVFTSDATIISARSGTGSGNFAGILLRNSGTNQWSIGLRQNDANNLHLFRDGASGDVIISSGNIGIGTTSPSAKLHVEDGSMLLGDISGGSTSTPSGYKLQFDNSFAPGTTDSSYAPKIVMHQAATWLGGFGISDSHVDYFSGNHHRWFTGTTPNTPTRGTLRLKIWDSGYITMPTQTMISARHNATEAPSGGTVLLNWTIDVNQGGGSWNSGTGTYTVPVAGRYLVTCSLLRNTGGAAGGIVLHKNGVSVNRMFYVDSVGTTGYGMGSGQIIVDCGAGDSLRFMNENTVGWYGDGAGLGSFTINLLG